MLLKVPVLVSFPNKTVSSLFQVADQADTIFGAQEAMVSNTDTPHSSMPIWRIRVRVCLWLAATKRP
uniref:Uncharacterized protein n=1 Tax=Arion vulgaris TaxID=1028688 RepID=A0A0B7ARX6_9EUPU